jgi:tetratricopeptide (TPR) repeat protein
MQAQMPQPTDFDGWKNRGILFSRTGQYQEAADAFEHATNLKPNDTGARLYLGLEHMLMSFGAQSPENVAHASRARSEFQRVIELDPENAMAFAALAAMSYQEAKPLQGSEKLRKLHEARDWSKRVVGADRTNKQAYFSLGVIAWTEFHPVWMEARATDGLKPGDWGPLRTAASRTKLLSQYGPLIEDGIANLREAIKIDPQYDRALAYVGALVMERADLCDTPDQYKREIGEAGEWTQRQMDARREKLQRPQQPAAGSSGAWFESLTLVLPPLPAVPPPPPPRPPGVRLFPFVPADAGAQDASTKAQAEAHDNLGAALGKKGDWDGEIAEEREALRLNPNNGPAHVNLGVALFNKGTWMEQ